MHRVVPNMELPIFGLKLQSVSINRTLLISEPGIKNLRSRVLKHWSKSI